MAGTQNAEHLIDKTRTDADKNAVCTFLIHAAMLAGVLFVLFGIIFGLSAVPDDSMEPVLSAGDLVFYYRLDRDFRRDDIVVYEANGEMRTGRIAAGPGDSVEVSEDAVALKPISYYGGAKLGSEGIISSFAYMNDMSVLVFRFPNVIGPRLTHGVIFDFVKRLKADPTHLRILGDGTQSKPYIYVMDLVDAIMRFKDVEKGVTLYNVGVETQTSVTRIAEIVCEKMGLPEIPFEYTGGRGGWKGDVPVFAYNLDKIHAAGWGASMTSDEAVAKTVEMVL